jgi:phenylalanyl-tRNA synthetase beta chain
MKFTLSLLKKFLKTDLDILSISSALTDIGIEVEQITDNSKIYGSFIISEIISANPHPDARNLQVCEVSDGTNVKQIVCGARNARTGIKVVLAPIGSVIPANNMIIKPVKIRGIESNGMLCSFDELSIEGDSEGIIELPINTVVGTGFAEYMGLNEVVVDVSITPNRGDALSVYGIARDLAAYGAGDLLKLTIIPKVEKNVNIKLPDICIEDIESCYSFCACRINNIKNSSDYYSKRIKNLMRAIGSNDNGSLVDISNYGMICYGRPNHFYDADKIEGAITVRKSRKNEKFTTLGKQELVLPEGITVVVDDRKILSIAGIIGGESSKIDENTENIIIEVGNWNPISIINAGWILNIATDSRYRLERRVDFGNTLFFMNYLIDEILKSHTGEASEIAEKFGVAIPYIKEIKFDYRKIEKISGLYIEKNIVDGILYKLGFEREGELLKVPSWRQGDIEHDIDIVEEILRIYGYDKVPAIPLSIGNENIKVPEIEFINRAGDLLIARNFNEVITWSFISEDVTKKFGFDNSIILENPISNNMKVMRRTILPGLLVAVKNNISVGYDNLNYFEIGNIYDIPLNNSQEMCVAGIRTGKFQPKTVFKTERSYDFFDIKADVFSLIKEYGLDPYKVSLSREVRSYYHPGCSIALMQGNNLLGYCGQLHPKNTKDFDLSTTLVFELFINRFPEQKSNTAKPALTISNIQSVTRDFAFIVKKDILTGDIVKNIKSIDRDLIETADVFDIYEGEGIESDKKSVAISVTLRPKKETLTESQINNLTNSVVSSVIAKFNADQR